MLYVTNIRKNRQGCKFSGHYFYLFRRFFGGRKNIGVYWYLLFVVRTLAVVGKKNCVIFTLRKRRRICAKATAQVHEGDCTKKGCCLSV